ncbi:hypothetical protein Tco_0819243 [Tanacetum coccineum]|uniref:Uncharacterized protein n=1 Tax=Tanacetum coccineum TaxID=301880 RepID=A0ABQ5AAL4_9ASTR
MPHDSPLSGVARVTSLEKELKKTKEVHGKVLTKLVKKVKRLEDEIKSTNKIKKAKMVIPDDEELVLEDPSKQGRMEETEYVDVEEENAGVENDFDLTEHATKILAEASKERVKTYNKRRGSTDSSQVSIAAGLFDQERKEADNIDWNKLVEQVQERQSGSMIRYQALKKKPVTVAQARKNMMVYLKNMANYKMSYFKDVEMTKKKRVAEEALLQESFKKLRTAQALVKEKFRSVEPIEDMERSLWVELKRLYKPDKEDTLWKLQRYMHDPLTWRLYRSCAIHHVFSTRGHCIYMLPEKDYPLTTEVMMLMLSRRLQVEEDSEMARDLVKKIFIEANR